MNMRALAVTGVLVVGLLATGCTSTDESAGQGAQASTAAPALWCLAPEGHGFNECSDAIWIVGTLENTPASDPPQRFIQRTTGGYWHGLIFDHDELPPSANGSWKVTAERDAAPIARAADTHPFHFVGESEIGTVSIELAGEISPFGVGVQGAIRVTNHSGQEETIRVVEGHPCPSQGNLC